MKSKNKLKKGYFNSVYVGNWADMYFRKISDILLRRIIKIKWITPNGITIFSSFIFIAGCFLLFINIPYHLYYAAFLIFIGYIGDLLDGDLARKRNISSAYGAYLDAVVDVFKIYFITISLSIAVYLNTDKIIYIFLGFTACAAIFCRFYIKQYVSKMTLVNQIKKNPRFIYEIFKNEKEWKQKIENNYMILSKSFVGRLKILWLKNKNIFLVDEAEIAVFTSLACIFNKLTFWLWILTITQVVIVLTRFFQRGYQLRNGDIKLIQKTTLEI